MFGLYQHAGDSVGSWKGLAFVFLAAAVVGGALVWFFRYAVAISYG